MIQQIHMFYESKSNLKNVNKQAHYKMTKNTAFNLKQCYAY